MIYPKMAMTLLYDILLLNIKDESLVHWSKFMQHLSYLVQNEIYLTFFLIV